MWPHWPPSTSRCGTSRGRRWASPCGEIVASAFVPMLVGADPLDARDLHGVASLPRAAPGRPHSVTATESLTSLTLPLILLGVQRDQRGSWRGAAGAEATVTVTMKRGWLTAAAATLLAVALAAPAAPAGEVRVISAGAVRAIVTEMARAYEKETGHTVTLMFGTVGVVRQKMAADPADVVIMTDVAVDESARQGAIVGGSRVDIARTGMGVGVREGAPRPDISSTEAFKRTLLAARSIVYVDPAQGATSGIHFASVLRRLGIADAMKPKTTLVPGGYPADLVAKGEVELVVHQISEIVPVKGVTLVGPLPKDLQKVTTYSAGVAAKTTSAELARGFIAFLTRPAFRAKFAEAGLDYKE